MLLTPAASWSAVDDDSFDIHLTDRGHTVTARVLVDQRGAPRGFSSEDRYVALPEGLRRARWTTPVHELSPAVDGSHGPAFGKPRKFAGTYRAPHFRPRMSIPARFRRPVRAG
jgi:hypothetical protein